jgi:hypothetical protein
MPTMANIPTARRPCIIDCDGKVEVPYFPKHLPNTLPATLRDRLMGNVHHLPEHLRKGFLDDVFTITQKYAGKRCELPKEKKAL